MLFTPVATQAKSKSKEIAITKKNFPDKKLRNSVRKKFDKDKNGKLSPKEIRKATKLKLSNIKDLNLIGIERLDYLRNLTIVHCNVTKQTSIKKCSQLRQFICTKSTLAGTLDLSDLKELRKVNCSKNKLTRLLLNNSNAASVRCTDNSMVQLSMLNTDVKNLYCTGNLQVEVIVPRIRQWTGMESTAKVLVQGIAINKVNFPDSGFRKYVGFYIDTNQDDELDFSEVMSVKKIDIGEFSDFRITDEQYAISSLRGIRFFKNLEYLDCSNNTIYDVNVSYNTKLKKLYCNDNHLTSLSLVNNHRLERLDCSNNEINKLNVTSCKSLSFLNCNNNKLGSLDLRNARFLYSLFCRNNRLIAGNCYAVGSQLVEFDGAGQTMNVRVKRKKSGYMVKLLNLKNTNQIKRLSKGKVISNGIRISKKKLPAMITYQYNMFRDGNVMTDVAIVLKNKEKTQ